MQTPGRGLEVTRRMVFGVSDWPEEFGLEFEIVEVLSGESDADAIARARSHYNPDLECFVKETK